MLPPPCPALPPPLLQIGPVKVGSEHPIALQTMTTTDTRDVEATVEQVKRCADAGASIVRITVQGKKEAEACMRIRERLFQDRWGLCWVLCCAVRCGGCWRVWSRWQGCGCWQLWCAPCVLPAACLHRLTPPDPACPCLPLPVPSLACRYDTPLVADIHFQPAVAMMVADAFEKIRINPGARAGGRQGLGLCLRCSGYPCAGLPGLAGAGLLHRPGGPGGLPNPMLHPSSAPPRPAGNFADGRKTFDVINYDDPAQFAEEREYIRCQPARLGAPPASRLTGGCWNTGMLGVRSQTDGSPRGCCFELVEGLAMIPMLC